MSFENFLILKNYYELRVSLLFLEKQNFDGVYLLLALLVLLEPFAWIFIY